MSVNGSASGMRDEDRLFRFGNAFRGSAVSAVAQVDGHSEIVHLFHSGNAGFAESGVAGFQASIAEDAAIVVSELHDSDTELAKHFNALGLLFEERGVL